MRDEERISWAAIYEQHYIAPYGEEYEKAIVRANQMRAEAVRHYLGAPFRGLARLLRAVREWGAGHTAHHRLP